MTVPIQVVISL